jgi:hypothetical protein
MTAPFQHHKQAAYALITSGAPLKQREGQFLGGLSFMDEPMTPKQEQWLSGLLRRHGLPPLEGGG